MALITVTDKGKAEGRIRWALELQTREALMATKKPAFLKKGKKSIAKKGIAKKAPRFVKKQKR